MYPSIAIGTYGLAVISYWGMDSTPEPCQAAHCDDLRCSSATINGVSGQCGKHSSIAIGWTLSHSSPTCPITTASKWPTASTLNARIGTTVCPYTQASGVCRSPLERTEWLDRPLRFRLFISGRYRLVHCNNLNCSASTFTYLSSNSDDRYDPVCSATIGDDGLGVHRDRDTGYSGIRMVRCANALCSSPTNTLLVQGKYPSLIRGSNQRGLLAIPTSMVIST